jgi:D-alanine-D-alanine ligase
MKVAVLGGGRSSEYDLSVSSAEAVCAGVGAAGHEPCSIAIDRDGRWWAGDEEVSITPGGGVAGADVVFPVLIGQFGEDGCVQGLLELADVAYVGSGVTASAVCFDKVVFKRLLAAHGLPQGPFTVLRDGDDPAEMDVEPPCFVKPSTSGSSIGVTKVTDRGQLADALTLAYEHGPEAIVEAAIAGVEVECAVVGNRHPHAFPAGEVITGADWQTHEAKYTKGLCGLEIPVRTTEATRERIQSLACEAYRVLGCEGLARVDLFLTDRGPLINEVNTMPGFGTTSSFPELVKAAGTSYEELIDRLLALALERHARRRAPGAARSAEPTR